jgi:hypothetical protein
MDALKQQAMDNPMQAIAAGTAIAVPAMRLARGFPLPLLMIGAGLALSSKTVRDRAAEAAAPGIDKAREVIDEAAERAQSLGDGMRQAMSHAERQAAGMAGEARETAGEMADAASGMAGDLRDRAAQAADAVANKVRSGMDAASEIAKEKMEQVRSTATNAASAAPATASKVIRDNAALIGGLGVAIGAILAASLPSTRAEASVIGNASDRVKRAAGSPDWRLLRETVVRRVFELVRGVRRGEFPLHSLDEHCTAFCDFRTVCRVHQVRALGKQWPPPPQPSTR